jgi:hypothetical protein
MKLYRGNAHWLYQQLKRKYIDVYGNETGLMPYDKFRDKITSGSEMVFAGCSFKSSENYSIAMDTSKFKQFSGS